MEKGTMLDHVMLTLEQRVAAYYKSKGYELPLYDPSLSDVSEAAYDNLENEVTLYQVDGVKVWHSPTTHETIYVYEGNPEDNEGANTAFFIKTDIAQLYGFYAIGKISDVLDVEASEYPYPFYTSKGTELTKVTVDLEGCLGKPTYVEYKNHIYVVVRYVDGSRTVATYNKTAELENTLNGLA